MDKFDCFAGRLRDELLQRYHECNDAAVTPSDILLSVLNAVEEAIEDARTLPKMTGDAVCKVQRIER